MIRVLAIFLGSFLSFGVQPLVGKTLLPAFGGMASVWVTCLASFQCLLLVGYFYAHWLGRNGVRPRQLSAHVILLIIAAVWLVAVAFVGGSLARFSASIPVPAAGAVVAVLLLVAIPYVLLSANASLVQTLAGGDYRLYAVSNLGSFAGLFASPLVAEPFLSISAQWLVLAVGIVFYAAMLLKMKGNTRDSTDATESGSEASESRLPVSSLLPDKALWLVIPAVSCFFLNAVTAYLTSDVAPIPLVWAIVLGIYLLSYVIGFAKWGELVLPLWLILAVVSGFTCIYGLSVGTSSSERFIWNFPAILSFLLFACTALHAALCRARPCGRLLTRYNLCIAAGGAVGGAVGGLAMPVLTSEILEYPLSIAIVLLLSLSLVKVDGYVRVIEEVISVKVPGTWLKHGLGGIFLIAVVMLGHNWKNADGGNVLAKGRTFYGAWLVRSDIAHGADGRDYPVYIFSHGGTAHGVESVDEEFRHEGTAYYGPKGAGLAFDFARERGEATNVSLRCGIIGLGIGTMAHWGRPGDFLRFYEICPSVADVAEHGPWFNFMRECQSQRETVIGDARQALEAEEREGAPKYDMFAVDAYSGDSIPMHLMTAEAFDLYRSRLEDDGVLALHISNWHIDLLPVAKAAAKRLGWTCTIIPSSAGRFTFPAVWAFIAPKAPKVPDDLNWVNLTSIDDIPLPTDAKSSILPYLKLDALFSLKED